MKGKGHIVLTTGFQRGEFYDNRTHWVATCSVEQIAEMLIKEIKEGLDKHSYNGPIVERVSAKAGVIKVGSSYGVITPFEKKVFQAASIAQQETGAPIVTHTERGTMAMEQVNLLKEYGANLEKVILSHVQKNPDPYYHKKLVETGVTLCYDGPARVKYYSDNIIADLIYRLVEAGYQKHIVLSMDAGRASYQKAYGNGYGIDYMLTVFVPRLKEEGLSQKAIDDILINNPARLLAIEKK
jgi:phosphotriesterase-related protein